MRNPNIGDKVFLQYGVMCGSDFATVIAKREGRWGATWEVALVDGGNSVISGFIGTTDDVGRGARKIGAYLVFESVETIDS